MRAALCRAVHAGRSCVLREYHGGHHQWHDTTVVLCGAEPPYFIMGGMPCSLPLGHDGPHGNPDQEETMSDHIPPPPTMPRSFGTEVLPPLPEKEQKKYRIEMFDVTATERDSDTPEGTIDDVVEWTLFSQGSVVMAKTSDGRQHLFSIQNYNISVVPL